MRADRDRGEREDRVSSLTEGLIAQMGECDRRVWAWWGIYVRSTTYYKGGSSDKGRLSAQFLILASFFREIRSFRRVGFDGSISLCGGRNP